MQNRAYGPGTPTESAASNTQCPELEPLCIAHRHKDALGQIRNTPQEADTGGGVARSSDPRSLQNVRPSCHRCA
jgi:hypothetical protein